MLGGCDVRCQRYIRRKNEAALWRGWSRTEGIYRLLYEGDLDDFDDLQRGTDLDIKPYAIGRVTATDHDALGNSLQSGGADGKRESMPSSRANTPNPAAVR